MNSVTCQRARISRMPILLIAMLAFAVGATGSASASTEQTGASTPPATGDQAGEASARLTIDGRVSDRNSLRGDGIRVRGVVHGAAGRSAGIRLQVRKVGSRRWRGVARTRAVNGKKFTLRWRGGSPGRYLTRIVAVDGGRRSSDRLGAAFVYRATFASWYGPGFMGNRTACGQRLTGSILGVAHKTLPCGTRVTFHLRGRTITARVIDRGPYAHGRDWDLTPALKRKLHFGSTGTVHTTS